MSPWSVKFVAINRSPRHIIALKGFPTIVNPAIGSPVFGLIEAVSKAGTMGIVFWASDWARVCVVCSRPNVIGAATANNPATLRNHRHRWLSKGLADLLDCNVERSVRSRRGVTPGEIASQGDQQRKRNQEFHRRCEPEPIANPGVIFSQY